MTGKSIFAKLLPIKIKMEIRRWIISLEWFIPNCVFSSFPSHTIRKFVLKLYGSNIAKDAIVYGGSEFRNLKGLIIGSHSSIGHRALLDARKGLVIGKCVTLATEVMIWTLQHDYNDPKFKGVGGEVTIGDYTWLGSRCIILPGVKIGEYAIVAAGSVVTKNVAPYSVVGGIPAKEIRKREMINYEYNPSDFRMHMV